jgi:hypothetical protein
VENRSKDIRKRIFAIAALLGTVLPAVLLGAQSTAVAGGPPPSTGGFFPLSEVHRGLIATAWTVFTGDKPEPMQVEILGVLKGARGPGHDMILAQLHGTKPEYTGVVAGMSGSPVYVGNKLLGSLSYRIGQFSKDPIAGITPIEQMLEVRDMPIQRGPGIRDQGSEVQGVGIRDQGPEGQRSGTRDQALTVDATQFQAMETPLVMSGFHSESIKLWQEKTAGSGLEMVAAGGGGSSKASGISAAAIKSIEPGSAVSALLVEGDLEIAATCTVTYVDPKQLLACGHPILQAGPVSLPMTATDVVATLASPLNAFKIVNTGELVGAFTEDRDSAIRGVFGETAHMIPVHISVHSGDKTRNLHVEVLDLPALTPQALLVSLYEVLLQTNESTADTSYHVTGTMDVDGYPSAPVDVWTGGGEGLPPQLVAALLTAERFQKLYANGGRREAMKSVDLHVEVVPRRTSVELVSARLTSGNIVHPGDTVTLEATLRPWQQAERNVRIPFKVPARLESGTLRVLVSDSATLDHTMMQPKMVPRPTDMRTVLAEARNQHAQDRIYVSLLVPETQAGMEGQTLSSVPISLANALEPMRAGQDVTLNGESAVVAAEASANGVLTGFEVLSLRIDAGGGVD